MARPFTCKAMATPIVMPQMGESIAEGTIVRWIKKVGDRVDRDEPLFEITTDKVDAEIPAPAAGVLTEIKVKEGETVAVNTVVGTIGAAGEEAAASAPEVDAPSAAKPQADGAGSAASPATSPSAQSTPARAPRETPRETGAGISRDELRRQKSSPLVRRIAQENDVDIS